MVCATSECGWVPTSRAQREKLSTRARTPRPVTDCRSEAVSTVEVDGYTPRMRAGIHTGHPQRIGLFDGADRGTGVHGDSALRE